MVALTVETLRSAATEWFTVDDASASGSVRRAAARLAHRLGFPETRCTEVGIVASETAANIFRHAGHGTVALQIVLRNAVPGVQIVGVDRGPGIADISLVSTDGHSTTGTLGVGLGAITRLSDELDISSNPGQGTVLVAELWHRRPASLDPIDIAGLTRPISGEEVCGDAVSGRGTDGHQLAIVVDGLGHGPLAAAASSAAIGIFHETESIEPAEILREIGLRIGHTRGAVAAVIALDPSFRQLRFAGVGNISAFVDRGARRQTLLSQPGIVGQHNPRIRPQDVDVDDKSIVVMHSDGVRDNWKLDRTPGLRRRSSIVIATSLLRDAGNRPDDASVLTVRRRQ